MRQELQLQKRKSGDPHWKQLVEQGRGLEEREKDIRWAKGDLLNAVRKEYGEETLKRFADDCGWAESEMTLYQYGRVSRSFPENFRRIKNLSFTHFVEVTGAFPKEEEEKERNDWLKKAEAEQLSTRELKWELQKAMPKRNRSHFEAAYTRLNRISFLLDEILEQDLSGISSEERRTFMELYFKCGEKFGRIGGGGGGSNMQSLPDGGNGGGGQQVGATAMAV